MKKSLFLDVLALLCLMLLLIEINISVYAQSFSHREFQVGNAGSNESACVFLARDDLNTQMNRRSCKLTSYDDSTGRQLL